MIDLFWSFKNHCCSVLIKFSLCLILKPWCSTYCPFPCNTYPDYWAIIDCGLGVSYYLSWLVTCSICLVLIKALHFHHHWHRVTRTPQSISQHEDNSVQNLLRVILRKCSLTVNWNHIGGVAVQGAGNLKPFSLVRVIIINIIIIIVTIMFVVVVVVV